MTADDAISAGQKTEGEGKVTRRSRDPRPQRGRTGELLACEHLEARGYEVLERNFRSRYGEIDIIARRGRLVAFVEVKARRSRRCGEPFEAVGPRKQAQIRRMAEMWVAGRQRDPKVRECSFRFDVISIMLGSDGSAAECLHLQDAFR